MSNSITIGEIYRQLAAQLGSFLDAGRIVEFAIGKSRAEQIVSENQSVHQDDLKKVLALAERRKTGEPLDHIFGTREFYGLTFRVNKHVLSPRPETEMLVDFVFAKSTAADSLLILDLGTGSGAIPTAILKERANAHALAVDVSEKALEIARENATRHVVSDRIEFVKSNWFEKLSGTFDFILSNPPYITDVAMKQLDREVSEFDPEIALSGGQDGLDAYREIISKAPLYLSKTAWLAMEIGFDQAKAIIELLDKRGFKDILVQKDLAGHDRLVAARP
ncbi:MAG: peptide chain release factor N(5)-glutamine methyltransferase [Hellea sp.]|nr:peptide chain release factor N(5)-glutamine methyltransferase [Hellea sp.]